MSHTVEKQGHVFQSQNSSGQALDHSPNGASNFNKVMVRPNPQGQVVSVVELENVMSRAMSKVMVQLESITADPKQVPAIKAATAKLNREMVQVRQDCFGIKETVKDLCQKEEDNSSKHAALAKVVRDIRWKMEKGAEVSQGNNLPKAQTPRWILSGEKQTPENPI